MQKKKYINFSTVGFASAGAFSLITLALLLPTVDSSVHATCADGDTSEGCVASMASMDAEVTVGTSIAIAMDSKVTMDITPSSTGSVSAVSSKVQVMTNSIDGYALFMKADPELVNTSTVNDGAVVNSITNTSTTDTLSNMAENTYGYSISAKQPSDTELMNSTYQPLDTTGTTPIRQTTSTSIGTSNTDYGYGEEYYLNLGVKVGTNLPAGTYAGTVTLSAVANPVTVRSMAGLTYMQDITHDICANTIEHYTKRLTDTRDGNKYWVAKLKDGNCWMTQNLALDLSTEQTLTSGDTDLTSNWTPPMNTRIQGVNETGPNVSVELTGSNQASATDRTYSWDFGDVVLATPDYAKDAYYLDNGQVQHYGANWGNPGFCSLNGATGTWMSVTSDQRIGVVCSKQGYIDVTGWKSDYRTTVGKFTSLKNSERDSVVIYGDGGLGGDEGLVSVKTDTTGNIVKDNSGYYSYDAHYSLGNYYQWSAATAGKNADDYSSVGKSKNEYGVTDAPTSICPKGWHLPTSGMVYTQPDDASYTFSINSYNISGSIAYLLRQYGLASASTYGYPRNSTYNVRLDGTPNNYSAAGAPLYLTRTGAVGTGLSSVAILGMDVSLTSSTIATAGNNFMLKLNTDGANSAAISSPTGGLSIRCLAR